MRIARFRYQGVRGSVLTMFGGVVLGACGSAGVADDDVQRLAVHDGSFGAIGVHGAALNESEGLPVAQSVITDAIVAIAVAEEGKGPAEVGVSTGYPLSEYAGDITGGWCSEFTSWAYWRGGCPFSDQWGAYPWMIGGSEQIREWFLEHSRFVHQTDPEWETYVPRPGDYIRYNTSGGGHSGIVRYVEGTSLYTVEGNVNDVVMLRRLRDYLTAYSDPTDGIDGFGVNPCGDQGAGGAAGGGAGGGSGGVEVSGGAGGSGGAETGGAAGQGETGGLGTGGRTTGGTSAGGSTTGGFATGGVGTGGEVGASGFATGGGSGGGMSTQTGGASAGGGMVPSTGGSSSGGSAPGAGGMTAPTGGSLVNGGSPAAGGSGAAGDSQGGSGETAPATGEVTASGGGADPGVVGSAASSGGPPTSGTSAVAAPGADDGSTAEDGGCACAVSVAVGGSGKGVGIIALLLGLCLRKRGRRLGRVDSSLG